MAATFTTYTDPFAYRRTPTGLESDTLLGNLTRLSSGISLGATSLPVSPVTTVALSIYDRITIFDGANSEVVTVTSITTIGQSSIPCTPTLASHGIGTVLCSDGTNGSLADMIAQGSSWLETITEQPRWATSYTETLQAPSMRASIDRNYAMVLRPRRFPVVSVSSLSYQTDPTNVQTLNTAYAQFDGELQTVVFPAITQINGNQGYQSYMPIGRSSPVWITLSYTAGYSNLPGYIVDAANLLVSDLLAMRQNPAGFATAVMGKRNITAGVRGDTSGKSLLVKRAEWILRGDIERTF